jgi:hypothetical protein
METFTNLEIFDKNNARILLNTCWGINAWGADTSELPTLDNFTIIKSFQGYDPLGFCDRNFCALYYSVNLNMAIVFFTGTTHFSEWLDDFDFFQENPKSITSDKMVLVHNKMFKIYNSLRIELLSEIKNIINEDTVLISCGHSLGGALSTLCYFDFVVNNVAPKRTLYSFASPRLGNVAFVNVLNKEKTVFRVANSDDLAVNVPLPICGSCIYSHFSNTIAFAQNLGKTADNHGPAYTNFLN